MNLTKAISDIQSNKEKTRNSAFKFLLPLSERDPDKIYPYWDVFVDILRMQEVSNNLLIHKLLFHDQNKVYPEKFTSKSNLNNSYNQCFQSIIILVYSYPGLCIDQCRLKPGLSRQIHCICLDK